MKKNIVILYLLILGCSNNKSGLNTKSQSKLKFVSVHQIDAGLSVEVNNNNYKIEITDSLFNYSISPDSSALLVNHRIMSNIQVSQYYELDKDSNDIRIIEENLSISAWDSIGNKFAIDNDDIINPKTMASFTEENKVRIKLNGQTELGIMINEVIEIDEKSANKKR